MVLLDTNICTYLMKGSFPSLNQKVLNVNASDLAISAITLFELEYGAAKANWGTKRREDLNIFLSAFTVIPFEGQDAIAAGRIRAELVRSGLSIGAYDLQIAAQGVARGITVVTHNTREFIRVPGISLEDWVEE